MYMGEAPLIARRRRRRRPVCDRLDRSGVKLAGRWNRTGRCGVLRRMRWRRGLLCAGLAAGLLAPVVAPMDAVDAAAPPTVVVKGRATVDGEPFDARFLGAVVLDDGLS